MSSLRLVALMIVIAAFAVGRGMWRDTAIVAPVSAQHDEVNTTAVADSAIADEASIRVDSGSALLDRYGNQVDTAIGDYRIDPRGDIYERHSPDTAVPKLASPKS